MTGRPAKPTRSTSRATPERGTDKVHRDNRIRRRDWIVIAVVAAVAAGLGLYLLAAPGESSPTAAGRSTPPVAGPTTPSGDSGTSPSGSAPGSPSPSGYSPSTRADDDVIASAVQPSGVTTAGKAGPIGPFGDLSRRIDGDPLALGAVDAPVVMVEFADYRCPFCAKFSQTHEPALIKKYVDTGIMRIEWRDLPIFGAQSERAAIAGRAAAAQGKFWEFNTAVYASAPQTGHPELSVPELVDFAAQAGVPDLDKFRADLDDPALKAQVAKDVDQATILGVPSTPAFVVNGYPMLGAQPIEDFYQLIDTVRSLQ